MATQIISDAGYQVVEASTAVEALAILHECRPALVISDALMPKLDGREMCLVLPE